MGNPLATSKMNTAPQNWPQICPHGYAQHLVTVLDGCEISFCVLPGTFKKNSLFAPKFRKHPKYKYNVSDTLAVFGVYGKIWVKNEQGGWDEIESGSESGRDLLATFDDPKVEMKNVTIGMSVLGTLCLGVIIIIAIFASRCIYKRR